MAARRWFPLAAVALGLSLPAVAELGLRASGRFEGPPPTISGETSRFREARGTHRGRMLESYVAADGSRRWRTPRKEVRERRMMDVDFAETPAEGVLRVFTFGGSAALGVPHERTPARTFPARLEVHLATLGVEAEVINLGGASYGSDHVRVLAAQAAGLGASALVVYAGNNEFFNYNMVLWEENQGWLPQARALESLRLQRALRQLLGRPLPVAPPEAAVADMAERQRELVREVLVHRIRSAGDAALPRNLHPQAKDLPQRQDPIFTAVAERYRENIESVAGLGENGGPVVILAAIPANLHEPPWLSLHGPPDALGRTAPGARAFVHAVQQVQDEGCAAARPALDAAVEASPLHAGARFQWGICGEREDWTGWESRLAEALELDMDPGRPPERFREILRDMDARPGVHTVDLRGDFEAADDGRWFHDSCHLTAEGQDHLGQVLAEALVGTLLGG